jgi:hypothetical protein
LNARFDKLFELNTTALFERTRINQMNVKMMRRLMTMLAAATLVLGVLTAAAEAHGSRRMGGLRSQIRFGGHPGPYGSGLHRHILHQLSPRYGVHNSYEPNCYFPKEPPKYPPWPPFCS